MFAELARTAQARYGFIIQPHRFAVTGLCASCRQLAQTAHTRAANSEFGHQSHANRLLSEDPSLGPRALAALAATTTTSFPRPCRCNPAAVAWRPAFASAGTSS